MNKKLVVAMIAAAWGHAALLAEGDGTPSLPCGREVVSRVNGGLRLNQTPAFKAARSVWPKGRETRLNDFVEFRASFGVERGTGNGERGTVLRITGSSVYRIWLNGKFVGYGPARAAKGFFRMDEWPLAAKTGRNDLRIVDCVVVHFTM